MRKVGDLFEFASIHTENFYRDNHYLLQAIIVMRSFQRVSIRVMTLIMMTKCSQGLSVSHKKIVIVTATTKAITLVS